MSHDGFNDVEKGGDALPLIVLVIIKCKCPSGLTECSGIVKDFLLMNLVSPTYDADIISFCR